MEQGNGTKKKTAVIFAAIGVMCVALMGCGGQEQPEPEQSAEEFLEQLDEEYQEMVEAEEEQHEAELEAEYPEGILPAGLYRVADASGNNFISGFFADYDAEHGEGQVYLQKDYMGKPVLYTVPSYYTDSPENCYTYDPETGLYHFDIYTKSEGDWVLLSTFEGYYNADEDTFTMTYFYSDSKEYTEEGYECVYQRE